jgi:hypothetical protein
MVDCNEYAVMTNVVNEQLVRFFIHQVTKCLFAELFYTGTYDINGKTLIVIVW